MLEQSIKHAGSNDQKVEQTNKIGLKFQQKIGQYFTKTSIIKSFQRKKQARNHPKIFNKKDEIYSVV